ncbi:response regulator [Desulfobotulus sp.]|jgi:PAS domain S-box-containing protein|uniref:hybrid sensor histidine kinase/response regulator n=1 Tax=Desulfobotulus sp. TaxID=1940337 RepID=UPI002A3606CB|nr:response regulator [Desulfobotulus sp.]MDY0162914.1 response regulator [Desulfobotulus sp.]
MKVLVVDDHEENLFLLISLLKGHGYTVIQARHGQEAMEALEKEGVDLIISDILMPVMDGFQLCRKVKADPRLRQIPFIVYTATYTGPQDEAFALKIGADCFIEKPCEPEIFMKTVQEVMGRSVREISAIPLADEGEVFKLYSERLVRKLEQKMLEAEGELARRLETEKALRESERRLITAQQIAKLGDFTWDLETGAITASPPLYALLGYETGEVFDYDRVNASIHHPEDLERVRQWVEACIASEGEELTPNEYRVLRKDGEVLFVRTQGILLHREGKKPLVFATVQDVSERKKAEQEKEKLQAQLFQAQKMESIGRLAGGVAHDFNNMLGVIMGYADLALMSLQPGDPLWAKLEEIRNAAARSAELTRQLLTFARKQTITPKVLHINAVVDSMLKMLRRLLGEEIHLDWLPGKDLWPVLMDASQVDQILANLCVNARDAIDGVGRISIATKNVFFDDADCMRHADFVPGAYVLLTVSDTGCGMDKETLDKIFEPFFTTKSLDKGTGLGLATVYGIVKQNNGFIHVYSEPGGGSTFRIYLRRHEGALDPPAKKASLFLQSGNETILLVEDELAFLQITTTMLQNHGYRVLGTQHPSEALNIAREYKETIHMLITDVVMPGMAGPDLAGQIRAILPQIRCLFMSGFTKDIITHRGILESQSFFIQKPFSMRDFVMKVRAVLDE